MQDNPASRSPKVFRPRTCSDCPASFVPAGSKQTRCPDCQEGHAALVAREAHVRKMAKRKTDRAAARLTRRGCSVCGAPLRKSNTIGRCQEHRYIGEGMGECAHCGKPIRRDNKTGYCEEHKYPTSRAPARFCASREGCSAQLRIDNESGYCPRHAGESPAVLAYRDRYNAALREQTRLRPDTREVCSAEECENRLRSDNNTGRCGAEHHYLPLDLAECEVDGCENRLNTGNALGRCVEHRGAYWALDAPKCRAGCGKTLHADNSLGYCHEHRGQSPEWREYTRSYYLSRQDELVEYARFYRLVYADEHRAYSRAHYAENGRITPEAQRAAAARRRQKSALGMDEVDRFLSAEYRKAIRNDPCFYCGAAETHHVDHFFPIAKGGTDAWFNLVAACRSCNLSKFTACGTAFLLRCPVPAVAHP